VPANHLSLANDSVTCTSIIHRLFKRFVVARGMHFLPCFGRVSITTRVLTERKLGAWKWPRIGGLPCGPAKPVEESDSLRRETA